MGTLNMRSDNIVHSWFNWLRAHLYLLSFAFPSLIGILLLSLALLKSNQGQDILVHILDGSQLGDRLLFVFMLVIFSFSNWFFCQQSFIQHNKRRLPVEVEGDLDNLKIYASKKSNEQLLNEIGIYYQIIPLLLAYGTLMIGAYGIVTVGIDKNVVPGFIKVVFIAIAVFTFVFSATLFRWVQNSYQKNGLIGRQLIVFGGFGSLLLLLPSFQGIQRYYIFGLALVILAFAIFLFLSVRSLPFQYKDPKKSTTSKFILNYLIGIVTREKSSKTDRWYPVTFYDILKLLFWLFLAIHILNNAIFQLPPKFGPIITFLFGLTSLTTLLGFATNLFRNNGIPILPAFLVLVFFWVLFAKNGRYFEITTVPSEFKNSARPELDAYLESWLHQKYKVRKDTTEIILVSSYGGGIRASFWTNLVLAKYMDKFGPDFFKNTLSLTGASGGMIGVGIFNAIGTEVKKGYQEDIYYYYQKQDFLSTNLAKLLGSDILMGVLPIRFEDRHRAIELEFQNQYRSMYFRNQLSDNFLSFWNLKDTSKIYEKPLLFATSTNLNKGILALYSPVKIPKEYSKIFQDMYSARLRDPGLNYSKSWDVPYTTAICQSARFPYISPAGNLHKNAQYADAGYFDNLGGEVTLMMLDKLMRKSYELAEKDSIYKNMKFKILIINSAPSCSQKNPDGNKRNFGIMIPVLGLYSTWNGHTKIIDAKIERLAEKYPKRITIEKCPLELTNKNKDGEKYIFPLGWYLSDEAMNAMAMKADSLVIK